MDQVLVHVVTAHAGPSTVRYGPFSREEAEAKLIAIGWTPGMKFLSHQVWLPPQIKGKMTDATAIITPLVPELPETIDVGYKDLHVAHHT
jgi:hypothetical protein